MDRVYRVDQKAVGDLRGVAVAIAETDDDQRHVGLLHRPEDSGPVLILELQWHHRLRNREFSEAEYLWVDPHIPARRLAQVSDVCRKVWRANSQGTVPYGFGPPTDCFDEQTGRYLFGPTGHGLTCATFVVAVFARAGLPLLDCDSWPTDRPGDRRWQEKIVWLLERTHADPDHVEAVRKDIGAARFRPEEVAGAATVEGLSATFRFAEERGRQILSRFRRFTSSDEKSHVSVVHRVVRFIRNWFRSNDG